ncbi:MAG: MBL fold metallo-hydrolase [Thermovenabulum sp.]|uniref:MBL fold metallo-hydrolase n=1 Tax=Thermovenabulum sp. TaxID=3100335 RepID=UPI003C7EB4FF
MMEVIFLGGAKEVGASCSVIKIKDKNIMIDAGIKVNEEGTESLPDISYLDNLRKEGKNLDAIIITHAHLDHCGALPAINKIFPEARIYCTPPTKAIMQVMLEDALKVARATTGLAFYDESDIDRTINSTITIGYETTYPIADGISMVLLNAGHVLGAAGVLLQSDEGTLLYTGDYTTFGQRTIEGQSMTAFLDEGVNVVISEATYGERMHPKRRDEIAKMMSIIEETIKDGGRVLIPAFALGRAQEVILAIKDNKKKGYKVYVDGLIRRINGIYKNMSNYLTKRCYKEIDKTGTLFYTDEIVEVESDEERKKILESNEPCVIIASSGMLTGGLSPIYAERLIGDKKNAIIIVGYQDEESPGRKLLELAEKPEDEREIELNGIKRKVKCRVEKCQLSAHADRLGIINFLESIESDYILLVHGDGNALESLYGDIKTNSKIAAVTQIAERGKPYQYNLPQGIRKRYSLEEKALEIALNKNREEEIDPDLLWEHLINNGKGGTNITIGDLMAVWYGIENKKGLTEEERNKFINLIRTNDRYKVNPYQSTVYIKSREEYEEEKRSVKMEQNAARELIEDKIGNYGLYKIGFENEKIVLYFHTPKYAEKCKKEIEELKKETQWEIEVSNNINTAYISEMIVRRLLKAGIELAKGPSFKGSYILVKLQEGESEEEAKKVIEDIARETGLDIRIDGIKEQREENENTPKRARLEQNYARKIIDDRINKEIRDANYKVKIGMYPDEGRMVLSFVSPEYGRRYEKTIRELEQQTGWDIEIAETYRQNVLIDEARKMLIERGITKPRVSFCSNYTEIRVAKGELQEKDKETIKREYEEKTGVRIEIKEL